MAADRKRRRRRGRKVRTLAGDRVRWRAVQAIARSIGLPVGTVARLVLLGPLLAADEGA